MLHSPCAMSYLEMRSDCPTKSLLVQGIIG
jgi:hypothetical protein